MNVCALCGVGWCSIHVNCDLSAYPLLLEKTLQQTADNPGCYFAWALLMDIYAAAETEESLQKAIEVFVV